MKENIKIIERVQQNPHYDPRKCNNGGGYDQPRIVFEFKGITGVLNDTSCGDFGHRLYVEYRGKEYYINEVGSTVEESDFDSDNVDDVEFVNAFNDQIKKVIRYRQDLEDI